MGTIVCFNKPFLLDFFFQNPSIIFVFCSQYHCINFKILYISISIQMYLGATVASVVGEKEMIVVSLVSVSVCVLFAITVNVMCSSQQLHFAHSHTERQTTHY